MQNIEQLAKLHLKRKSNKNNPAEPDKLQIT